MLVAVVGVNLFYSRQVKESHPGLLHVGNPGRYAGSGGQVHPRATVTYAESDR